jgi:hypothetical protein
MNAMKPGKRSWMNGDMIGLKIQENWCIGMLPRENQAENLDFGKFKHHG